MINIIAFVLALGFAIYNYLNCSTKELIFTDLMIALINLPFAIYWLVRWIA